MSPEPDDRNAGGEERPARPGYTEVVTARVRPEEVERLDRAAARRGITRSDVVAEAVDAFLARETWSGGFIAPPPPAELPGPWPWRSGAFGFRRRR